MCSRGQRTAGNFMRIMTIIVIKSKMLSNCLINLLCKLCGTGSGAARAGGGSDSFVCFAVAAAAAVGRRNFTISIKTSTI